MQNNEEILIKVENLGVVYENETILKEVSFDVRRGEIFCILGGSGCGKTTLLRQMIGIEQPTSGSVRIFGEDIVNATEADKSRLLRRFGVLFQSGALFNSMTLAENVALPLLEFTPLDRGMVDLIVKIKLHLVGLDGYGDYYPSELSGGMRKRAGLARAMAMDPEILFFDEPSSGLDPLTSAGLDRLIVEINASLGTTMVVVTHDLSSIYAIAHRAIMLDKSVRGIIASGSPSELKADAAHPIVRGFMNRDPGIAGV